MACGIKLIQLVISLAVLTQLTLSYKLNVPKVLLPFHSSKLISFVLEAKSETPNAIEDLCFEWSSSRPDIVSIQPIYDKPVRQRRDESNECSSRALVSAVSKHPQRFTSIILAKEIKTDKLIRCDVIVDKINSIRIKHTTTHLYLEDSPECFTVEALDAEGNTFSSIDGLPFEWTIINDLNEANTTQLEDSRNVLRVSKFIDSEYEVTESIKQLESIGLSGHKILIEGLKTGTANVQSKLLDPVYKDEMTLKTPLVRLLVVANILLEPSYPVYLLIGSTVKYNVFLIKQTSIEKVILPSLQYYFESRNATAANLLESDKSGSTIVGLAIGTTEIVLVDRNMKDNIQITSDSLTKPIVPPPTALVHVVIPDHLVFTIKNWRSSWILEVGRTYEIAILVYNDKRQQIFPSDNIRIDTVFETSKFRLNFQSLNGSYHIVTGLEKGFTQAQASLIGTIGPDNQLHKFSSIARGQVDIELLDPIDVTPKLVVFALNTASLQAFTSLNAYEYKLVATGGSGSYYWQSRNTTIANVNNQGVVKTTATKLGHTEILVTDTRNIDIQSKSLVYVLEPVDLVVQSCPVETQVGNQLLLNIKMNALIVDEQRGEQLVPITDCSRLTFDVTIQDESIFRYVAIQSSSVMKSMPLYRSTDDNSCAVLVLDAIRIGKTSIKISTLTTNEKNKQNLVQLNSNELSIGSYAPLKSYKNQLVLTRGSSLQINLFDGPLYSSYGQINQVNTIDSSQLANYQSRTELSDASLVELVPVESDFMPNKYSYIVKCLPSKLHEHEDSVIDARISIAHKQTNSNKCPLNFDFNLKIRCSRPHAVQLNQLMVFNDENTNETPFPLSLKWKCPIKLSSHQVAAHYERPLFVQVSARDVLNNLFDNFTSLHLDWFVENQHYMEKSHELLSSLVVAVSPDDSGIYLFNNLNNEFAFNSQRIYYQSFHTKSHFGKTKLKVKLHDTTPKYLESELVVNFVSDVAVQPESLILFNHPSNVVTLNLLDGSGKYHAEIETIRVQQLEDASKQNELGNVLKINQINENSIVVSPLLNNGLAYLHVFDYCVAPALLKTNIDLLKSKPSSNKGVLTTWKPSSSAKIQVAGINSILAYYEDDKVEVKKTLKIYVQISDSTGNLIKTNYFKLMNLNGKLTNGLNGVGNQKSQADVEQKIGSIEPASQDEYESSNLSQEEKEYTAIFVLNALKPGVINVQFEAHGDGYQPVDHTLKSENLILSQLKEIQIYVPLSVEPKYIELIRGSDYQVVVNGGPNSPDAHISYELTELTTRKNDERIIGVTADGIVNAVNLGQVKVNVKSVGYVCASGRALESSTCRCKSENRIQRVYSQDNLIVKVVDLHSIQIQVPIRTIKQGNEMPVYLMGNERSLNPLSFGACTKLKYSWKINDQQIGALHHQLLSFNELDLTSQLVNSNNDDLLFKDSFVLRFVALKPGKIKISVRVELDDGKALTDSVDVLVFADAYFTHFSTNYYLFKHPEIKKQLKAIAPLGLALDDQLAIEKLREETLLITPGGQFQVRTNYDKLASKMSYHLAFNANHNQQDDETLEVFNKYCNNNTIQISKDGLITVADLKLKNFKQCIATLLVTVSINEPKQQQQQQQSQQSNQASKDAQSNELKQQALVYEIKVKPIAYSMLKLNKKLTVQQNRLAQLDRQALLKNRLNLNSDGIKLQWNMRYYDDLGDSFDVVNTNTRYTLNRHDLIDFSQINSNLFVLDSSTMIASAHKDQELIKHTRSSSSMSHLADAIENSFVIRTIKPGRLVMQISPVNEASLDYLGLSVADLGENDAIRNLDYVRKLETTVGDFICLNENLSIEEDDVVSNRAGDTRRPIWSTQNPNVVSLIRTEHENTHYTSIGLCINEGQAILKKGDSSMIVDLNVRPLDRVKFVSLRSAKFITNVMTNANLDLFNLVQFDLRMPQNQNCSDLFERIAPQIEHLIPFKCTASLYTRNGMRLSYLDRLIRTSVKYLNRNWNCEVNFVSGSSSLLYDLIESNQERSDNNDNEPVNVKLSIEMKNTLTDMDNLNELRAIQVPFLPAFHVHTREIQLPITRSSLYLQNLKLRNQKAYSLSEHFNLIVYSTEQLHSHFVLSTNCPTLIQIKPLTVSRAPLAAQSSTEFASSVVKLTYDIATTEEAFDLSQYANVLQEQNGKLYVQITNSLTQQTEQVPLRFLFGVGEPTLEFKPVVAPPVKKEQSLLAYLFGWIFELTPNQITSFAIMLSLALITILVILRTRPLGQPTPELAAVAAAMRARSSGVKEHSSFNPYRYFSGAQAAYRRDLSSSFHGAPTSPSSFTYLSPQHSPSGSPLKKSPQKQSYLSNDQLLSTSLPSYQTNQNVPTIRSPRFSPGAAASDPAVRLFSVDSDVSHTSPSYFDTATNPAYQSRFNVDDNY